MTGLPGLYDVCAYRRQAAPAPERQPAVAAEQAKLAGPQRHQPGPEQQHQQAPPGPVGEQLGCADAE